MLINLFNLVEVNVIDLLIWLVILGLLIPCAIYSHKEINGKK